MTTANVVVHLFQQTDNQVVQAGSTIATGGAGRIFRGPATHAATGDGIAGYRAGADIADLEFMQFHPTTLYIAGQPRRLITETMRSQGLLVNHHGERFMPEYHGSLVKPRDIVSRAIVSEIKRGTRIRRCHPPWR